MLQTLLSLLIVASWIYWLVACWWVCAFFRARLRSGGRSFTPPVSILKPVRGLDAQAYQNFVSFCQQDYPDFELLFGVSDAADPVVPVVKRLQRDFPGHSIRLIVAPPTQDNRKASLLHSLNAEAHHRVLVVSDSDMRVTPDYLRRVVAPLADEQTGLVTCLYRGEHPHTLTARLEALYIGVSFLPSVLVARRLLDMRFAMGATVALRRGDLARLGGFAAVADYLADDYQLAVRIADLGLRVHLSDYMVVNVLGATTFREQWDREVRWIQCIRVTRPLEYPGLLLTFSTPLAVVLALVTGLAPIARLSLVGSLLLRWLVAWLVTGYTGNQAIRRWLLWLPLRDMLTALVWCAGLVGRSVVWRGEAFVLQPGGRLQPRPVSRGRARQRRVWAALGWLVRGLDVLLRRYYHIREFSRHDECLLRLAIGISDRDLTLSDGTRVVQGQPIGELHLWNDHIPPIPENGPDLAWALAFRRRLARSFKELAAYVESDPQYQHIKAFRGEISFGGPYGLVRMTQVVEHWGFDLVDRNSSGWLWQRLADFGANLYAWGLIRAFNPTSLEGEGLRELRRDQLWISRATLTRKYGPPHSPHWEL